MLAVPHNPFKTIPYKNGSTTEPVYSDNTCITQIGSLDQWEECIQTGVWYGVPIVNYQAGDKRKCGFVKFNPNNTY